VSSTVIVYGNDTLTFEFLTEAPPPHSGSLLTYSGALAASEQRQPAPPRSSTCQPPHTYTVSDLDDFEIHPETSPSASESHHGLATELVTFHVSSSAATTAAVSSSSSSDHTTITSGGGAHDPPVTICNTPPVSPAKKPIASPGKTSLESSLAAPRPNKVSAGMDFTRWLGESLALGGGGFYGGAFKAKTNDAITLSAVAASPSHAAESPPQSPIVTYRQRLPAHTTNKQADVELPSPAVPSLLPTVRPGPLRHAPSDQRREDMIATGPLAPPHDEASATSEELGEGGGYTEPALPPLQGQLFLDGEELVIPDPALGLLNCACERTVSVRPPTPQGASSGSWVDDFVDVCIDCGAVHQRVQLL
jgi:hypothetical protein